MIKSPSLNYLSIKQIKNKYFNNFINNHKSKNKKCKNNNNKLSNNINIFVYNNNNNKSKRADDNILFCETPKIRNYCNNNNKIKIKNNSNNNRFNIEEIFNKIKNETRSSKYKNNFYFNYNNKLLSIILIYFLNIFIT